MTILYKPVLIETAEQAEALPVGTIATHDEHWPVERCTPNRWESSARDMKHEEMVGWTALVPIEAKEERIKDYFFDCPGWMSRYATPWEES